MLTIRSLAPELAELDRQFAALKAEASELVNGLKESQFNWRPDAHSWSMAECLLHLNIVGARYVHVPEKTLAEHPGAGLGGAGPLWVRLAGEVDSRQHGAPAQAQVQGTAFVHAIVRPAHHGGAPDVPALAGATGAAA